MTSAPADHACVSVETSRAYQDMHAQMRFTPLALFHVPPRVVEGILAYMSERTPNTQQNLVAHLFRILENASEAEISHGVDSVQNLAITWRSFYSFL